MVSETIAALGHPNVFGTHKTTIEITKHSELSKRGDCIIGVNATNSCADLPQEIKTALKQDNKFIVAVKVDDLEEKITGFGSPNLILTNTHDIVLRKSSHIDDRTLLIKCDKACADLSREFINKLRNPADKLTVIVESP